MSLQKEPHSNLTFKELFNKGDFEGLETLKDAFLQTEDGSKFEVHRFLLASRNDYFRNLFCGDNATINQFTIPHMNAETLDQILVYLYTGDISLTEVNVSDVLIASNTLLVDDLVSKCQEFAYQNISVSNCLRLFIAALAIGKLPFVDMCYRYVQVHFEETIQKTENAICGLSLEALKKFLEDRNLNVTSERVTWMAIVRWVEENQQERLPYVLELFECLFLDTDECLESEILEHPLIKSNPFFKEPDFKHLSESPHLKDNLCEAFEGLLSESNSDFKDTNVDHSKPLDLENSLESQILNPSPLESKLYLKDITEPPKHFIKYSTQQTSNLRKRRIPTHINFIAFYRMFYEDNHVIQLYLTYDDQLDIWRQVGEVDFWPDTLLRINERIYMFNSLVDRRVAFDVCNGSLRQMSAMIVPRLHYRAISLEDSIYALGGGTEEDETTSILECYNPEKDLWYLRCPMVPMILSEIVAIDGRIFAIGRDDDGLDSEMKLQVYDTVADSWSLFAAPNKHRKQFASAVFEGKLYVIGGHDDYQSLKSSEVYDPSSNTWTELPDLPFAYILPKAVVLKQKLMVYEDLYKNIRYGVPHPPVLWNSIGEKWEAMNHDSCFIDIYLYQFCVIEEQKILQKIIRKYRSPNVSWTSSFLN